MHNKFCVIDYETVITGSYNWTRQAAINEENIVVFKDKKQADQFFESLLTCYIRGPIENRHIAPILGQTQGTFYFLLASFIAKANPHPKRMVISPAKYGMNAIIS
jgi:phosphatidylserine/phosphatidylglycerophosphate/cardiolipin synthase-like enzyme